MINKIDSVLEKIKSDFARNRFCLDKNKYLSSISYNLLNHDLLNKNGITIPFLNKDHENNIKIIMLKTMASELISHITYDIDRKIKVDIKANCLKELVEFINIYIYLFEDLSQAHFHFENRGSIIKDLNEHIKQYSDSYSIPLSFPYRSNFCILFSYLNKNEDGFYIKQE